MIIELKRLKKEWINKTCKIIINKPNSEIKLYFTATILEITEQHITFLDKYNRNYTFNLNAIEEIQEL